MNYNKWLCKNTHSLKGKTVAVSGATGGIGKNLCDFLSMLGANLVCLDRNFQKSNKMIADLKVKYPNLSATHITVDLEDIDAAKKFLNVIENKDEIMNIISNIEDNDQSELTFSIGDENKSEELNEYSIVKANYSLSDGIVASIGVVGPERMDYARIASVLKFIADELNDGDKGDKNG